MSSLYIYGGSFELSGFSFSDFHGKTLFIFTNDHLGT